MIDKELLRRRIAFIRQGSEVERWHTKRMLQRNDVGHHSFHVAWLAVLLQAGAQMDRNPGLILAALSHDLAEHITGDIPGDFKREAGIREQFSQYENGLFVEIGFDFESELSAAEKRILKLADMLEGAYFVISEASFGNARVGVVFANYRRYIESFAPFNECEAAIVEHIDELWAHYGVIDAPNWGKTAHSDESRKDTTIMGQDKDEAEDWGDFVEQAPAVRLEPAEPPRSPLIDELRREEAEGRATPPPAPPLAADTQPDPSKAGNLGVTGTPRSVGSDAMDDRATSDIGSPPSSLANQRQHGGVHYKSTTYQHWDFVLDTGQSYLQGCASKYVTRYLNHEDGPVTNLEKAIHYTDKAQEAQNEGRLRNAASCSSNRMAAYATANRLSDKQTEAISYIIEGSWGAAREVAREILHAL